MIDESSTFDLLSIVFVKEELSTEEFWTAPRTILESVIVLLLMLVFSARLRLREDSITELVFTALLSIVEPSILLAVTDPLVISELLSELRSADPDMTVEFTRLLFWMVPLVIEDP